MLTLACLSIKETDRNMRPSVGIGALLRPQKSHFFTTVQYHLYLRVLFGLENKHRLKCGLHRLSL